MRGVSRKGRDLLDPGGLGSAAGHERWGFPIVAVVGVFGGEGCASSRHGVGSV